MRVVLQQRLRYVTDLVDLISNPYESSECQEIIHDIAKKYSGPEYRSIGANVLSITVALMPLPATIDEDTRTYEYQSLIG